MHSLLSCTVTVVGAVKVTTQPASQSCPMERSEEDCKGRDNVHPSGGKGNTGEVEFSLMGRVHNVAIRIGDAERPRSDTFVDDRGGDQAEMSGATGISDGNCIGQNTGWRETYKRN
jgi:hypothetical protein